MNISKNLFNDLAAEIHNSENKKWWFDSSGAPIAIANERLVLLVISELMEAYEAFRKSQKDDKLTHRDGVEVELADAVIRLLDRMVGKNLVKFHHDYHNNEQKHDSFDFEEDLFQVCRMLGHPDMVYDTEFLVYSILDIGYNMGYDIMGAINEKRIFNATRHDHTNEARNGINGKKF